MKNKRKIIIIIFVSIVIICTSVLLITFYKILNPMMKAIVVKVGENYLGVMELDGTNSNLYDIGYSQDNNINFKQGQEILIYYDFETIILQASPGKIMSDDIKDIKIIKEKSGFEIPINVLKTFCNSPVNISLSITDISTTGLSLVIKDTNPYKSEFSNKYFINKREETLKKLSNVDTIAISNNIDKDTIKKTCEWKEIYGELKSGEYEFQMHTIDGEYYILLRFTVDSNGKIWYEKPFAYLI